MMDVFSFPIVLSVIFHIVTHLHRTIDVKLRCKLSAAHVFEVSGHAAKVAVFPQSAAGNGSFGIEEIVEGGHRIGHAKRGVLKLHEYHHRLRAACMWEINRRCRSYTDATGPARFDGSTVPGQQFVHGDAFAAERFAVEVEHVAFGIGIPAEVFIAIETGGDGGAVAQGDFEWRGIGLDGPCADGCKHHAASK